MSTAAWNVSVGAAPPGGVTAVKRVEQVVEVPATVLVLTQAERMLAKVSSRRWAGPSPIPR